MKKTRTPHAARLCFVMLLVAFGSVARADEPSADLLWSYRYLLASAYTEREMEPIAGRITWVELPNTALSDFAAEVLLSRLEDPAFPAGSQVLLVKLLIEANTDRYDAVLALLREKSKDQKAKRLARESTHRTNRSHQVPYQPGSIDVRTIVTDMEAAALAAKPTTAQAEHLAQFSGGTVSQLFEWAGRPQQILSNQVKFNDLSVQKIGFIYRGIGRFVYGNDPLFRKWAFKGFDADPLAFEQDFAYRERAQQLGLVDDATLEMTQLVSVYPAAKRRAVEINDRRAKPSLEFMDTAAEILVTQFQTAGDERDIDMYSWMCRLLTDHGGQRYAAILARVAAETQDSKLQRYARSKIETTNAAPATPYIPGTISLAAQLAKYPSPYPETTFQSGQP